MNRKQNPLNPASENCKCLSAHSIDTKTEAGLNLIFNSYFSSRRGLGLSPDLIVCRSERPIGQEVKDKISNFCHVAPEQVIGIPDLSSIYHVPLEMEANGVLAFLKERLQLASIPEASASKQTMQRWRELAYRFDNTRGEVKISLVGKYTKLEDSYASVSKSLQHASIAGGFKLSLKFIEACHLEKNIKKENQLLYYEAWQALVNSDGVIVPGGFGSRGMEGKIRACQWCRENRKPFLGICLGMQAAVIEFARNVIGLKDANTTEIDPNTKNPLVIDMPEHHPGDMGGTMRLGRRTTLFKDNQNSTISEHPASGPPIEFYFELSFSFHFSQRNCTVHRNRLTKGIDTDTKSITSM